jgi:hypothetical protein
LSFTFEITKTIFEHASHSFLVSFLVICVVQVLNFHETMESYRSLYYIGTVMSLVPIILGSLVKPAKFARVAKDK